MTPPEDNQRDEPGGVPEGPVEPPDSMNPPLDEEALWRSIVENYGERPQIGDDPVAPDVSEAPPPVPRVSPGVVRSWSLPDPAEHADVRENEREERAQEEHFVPPEPPPLPRGTPARRLAWCGLFLPPVLMVLAVALRWTFPTWASMLMVLAFVGGFVFLVATMPHDGGDGYDDGAVV
jgi:hypothetical protein